MNISRQHLQALYEAYCDTHSLWKNKLLQDVSQLVLPSVSHPVFVRKLDRRLRLGQLAEQFVFNHIESCDAIDLLAENIQIIKDKHTLGELDALLLVDKHPVHLEIIYKFYVYDKSQGDLELERWIGPNRKDSLIEKLKKLKTKQLPLLHSQSCQHTLSQINLEHYNYEQRVVFKAQLFSPYNENVAFKHINKDCLSGYYINQYQINDFMDYHFFIPEKIDWFLRPHDRVDWLTFDSFMLDSQEFLKNNQSPLFWMKNKDSELFKMFLVWW